MTLSTYESIFLLLSGSGLFLTGMRLMGKAIEGMALDKIKALFKGLGNRGIICYLLGMGVTSIIQASDATVALGMTLSDKELLSVKQATYISLGARLGTTITGVLVAFSTLNITPILMSLTLIGIIMIIFFKDKRVNDVGQIISGLGVLFVGIYLMGFAIKGNAGISEFFTNLFSKINFPPLLFILGVIFTALMQSSSAMSGLLIVMIEGGSLSFASAIFIVIGATVGTTMVPLVASFSMKAPAKRISFNYTFTALCGALVVGAVVWIFRDGICTIFDGITIGAWKIAIFNVCYSLTASLLMLPFVPNIAKLSEKVIHNENTAKDEET